MVETALVTNLKKDAQGNDAAVINSASHKTGKNYYERIVLSGYRLDFFRRYARTVRPAIVKQTASTCDKFFLQADGNEFTKFSEAPVKLQDRYNLPNINNNVARKSYETFVQKCDPKQKTYMADFLCHTEKVAGTHYAWLGNDSAMDAYNLQVSMQQFYRTNTVTSEDRLPTEYPDVDNVIDDDDDDMSSPKTRSIGKSRQTETETDITETEIDANMDKETIQDEQRPGTSETVTPKKKKKWTPSKSPVKGTRGNAMTPGSKARKVADWIQDSTGDFIHAEVGAKLIGSQFQFRTKSEKEDIVRKTRVIQNSQRELFLARMVVTKAAKRHNKKVGELKEDDYQAVNRDFVEAYMERKQPHAGSAWGNINTGRVNKLIRQLIKVGDDGTPTNDDIVDHIHRQDWQNIFIKDCGEDKGRGVFTGIRGFKMGTIVCDYHGDLIKGSEGEKRMKEYPIEDGSFMMFFKTDQGKMCVDACRPCSCHSRDEFFETKGRLINHSSARANLKVKQQELIHTLDNGETEKRKHVLLFARHDIPEDTELFFDYGVKCYEDKTRIPWAQN